MISWIQITFQKHFRVFFAVLLVFIIVSFVIYFAPGMGIGMGSTPRAQPRPFYGVNLSSEEEAGRIFGDASLSVFLQAGYPALDQNRMQEYALMRHAGLHLARQLNLPGPSGEELNDFIRTLGAFTGPQGEFDAARYQQFRDNLRTNPQLSEGDVSRVIADDFRYRNVQRLLAGPGYILPSEVKTELARSETSWTLVVAELDYTAFEPSITPTEMELTRFFEDNSFRYQIPARVSALYVEFPALAFLERVTLNEESVRAYYQANSFRFPKPENVPAVTTGDPSDADFLAVRAQVESTLRLERARQLAASAASDLSVELFENKVSMSGVGSFLAARGLTLESLPPFGLDSIPPQLGGNPEIAAEALRLNANRHFTDAVPTPAGSAVLFWQETIPSRTPDFGEVRDRVRTDVIADRKRARFVELGRTVREALAGRLRAGEAFEQAVTAAAGASGIKATARSLPAFTLQNPPADLNQAAYGALESLEQGGVSDMVLSGNTGLLVHAIAKQVPDVGESNPRYAELRGQIAQFTSSRNASEYLREMVDSELARTAPVQP